MQTLTQLSRPNFREVKFGRGGTILKARGADGVLSLDEVRAHAPSVFAEDKHVSRSERYTYIPTSNILERLLGEGFAITEVRQGGSRDEDKRGFTKHMVRLRRADSVSKPATPTLGVLWPEVVMVNSHDGTSSYQLYAGLFRYICTNGLIAGDKFDGVKVGHKGDIVSDVIEGTYTVIDTAQQMLEDAGAMETIKLAPAEQLAFANAALALRFDDPAKAPVDAGRLNHARRYGDNRDDLWSTYNRVQENLITGGLRGQVYDAETRQRRRVTTRPVNGVDGNRDLNRALHTLATEMAKLKAA